MVGSFVRLFFDADGGGSSILRAVRRAAVPVKKQYKVLAGPANMTHDFAPKCTLYCFVTRMVWMEEGGRRGAWLLVGCRVRRDTTHVISQYKIVDASRIPTSPS